MYITLYYYVKWLLKNETLNFLNQKRICMKNFIFLKILSAILLLQINVFAQTNPILNISCNSNEEVKEKSTFNLVFENVNYVNDRKGNEKSAIRFDGQTEIKVNTDINPVVMPELTVTFWAKPDFDNKQMTIFSHDDGGFDRSMAIDSRGGGGWKWTAYCNSPIGAAKINKSKWSFVAIVFDQTKNKVLIFVDGKFYEREGTDSGGLNYFNIGNNPSFGDPYFGLLDDIKFFDVALSREQISKLFKSEGGVVDNSDQYFYSESTENADIVVRVGDVDNLGFGWEEGFDPFCGMNTSVHDFPWKTDENDHPGTDRIMVVSSYKSGGCDGYTSQTKRPENNPVPIEIQFKKPKIDINKIVIQMMLDDFQSPVWGTSFQFSINGKRLNYVEDVINKLSQTGPVGKLVQVGLLPEDNPLFESGKVSIKIDDPITGAGDGFAIDFIQLLINPKGEYKCIGNISGIVKDEEGNLMKDVLVSANGLKESLTKENGSFNLEAVPIGMITVTANKSLYSTASINFELKREENKNILLILKKRGAESADYLNKELKEKGFVNLYGIHFDSGKYVPKKESESTLNALSDFLKNNHNLKLEIVGHTDSDGDNLLNNDLSLRRAKSVINWLKSKGIDVSNINASGLGESSPVASNETASGKALNRRVEIRLIK